MIAKRQRHRRLMHPRSAGNISHRGLFSGSHSWLSVNGDVSAASQQIDVDHPVSFYPTPQRPFAIPAMRYPASSLNPSVSVGRFLRRFTLLGCIALGLLDTAVFADEFDDLRQKWVVN